MSIVILLLLNAYAEDPTFVGTDAEGQAVEKPEGHLIAELGGSLATGNAVFFTLNGGTTADYKWNQNKVGAIAAVALGRAVPDTNGDGHVDDQERAVGLVENAKRAGLETRYDRFFGDKDSLYALGGSVLDPFAGYDLRTHEQVGYSRILAASETTKFVAEVGFDVAQENFVDGVDPAYADVFAARVLLGFSHAFSADVAFDDKVEAFENVLVLEDVRVLNTASLTSKLSNKFSLKLSHALVFDNVPVEGFLPLDQTSLVTFVATVL